MGPAETGNVTSSTSVPLDDTYGAVVMRLAFREDAGSTQTRLGERKCRYSAVPRPGGVLGSFFLRDSPLPQGEIIPVLIRTHGLVHSFSQIYRSEESKKKERKKR
jgi:hypothetical protein